MIRAAKRRSEHKTFADCDRVLKQEQADGIVVSNWCANDGDKWTCLCGRQFVHVCDGAEGCFWVPAGHRRGER